MPPMRSCDEALSDKLTTTAAGVNCNILFDSEIQRARTLLFDAEHKLFELNEELKALTARRDVQEKLIRKYRIALAPHRRLPPELLSEIFLHCLSTILPHSTLSLPPRTTSAPWVLGQVCARWRAISRADPRLWRPTRISIFDRQPRHLARACELLPPVARLSVTFTGPPAILTTTLIPYLWRIQDLSLRMGIAGYDELFQSVSPNDFVALQTVNFSIVNGVSEDITLPWERPSGIFSLASRFQQLKVETAGEFPVSKLGIPLGQITSLDISGMKQLDTQAVFSILRDCHWLESLDVSFLPPPDSGPTESPLYLPRLQSLRVHTYLPSSFQQSSIWGNLLSLNLLSALSLDTQTLFTILKESVNLIELQCYCPERGTMVLLARGLPLPSLRKLSLTNVADTWLFDSLVVPSLQELHIQSTNSPLNPPAIRDLLVYSGTRLSSFWFQSTHPQEITSPDGFRGLLDVISSAIHVEDTHSLIDETLLKDIASGALLPQLEFIRCWPETQEAFLDMAEARVWHASRTTSTSQPHRTLREAFGVSQIGVHVPRLTLASHLRLGTLSMTCGLICSLYPPSVWDEYPD